MIWAWLSLANRRLKPLGHLSATRRLKSKQLRSSTLEFPDSVTENGPFCQRPYGDPDPPIRGGLGRLSRGAVMAPPVDMGDGLGGKKRKVVRFFTPRV